MGPACIQIGGCRGKGQAGAAEEEDWKEGGRSAS